MSGEPMSALAAIHQGLLYGITAGFAVIGFTLLMLTVYGIISLIDIIDDALKGNNEHNNWPGPSG